MQIIKWLANDQITIHKHSIRSSPYINIVHDDRSSSETHSMLVVTHIVHDHHMITESANSRDTHSTCLPTATARCPYIWWFAVVIVIWRRGRGEPLICPGSTGRSCRRTARRCTGSSTRGRTTGVDRCDLTRGRGMSRSLHVSYMLATNIHQYSKFIERHNYNA